MEISTQDVTLIAHTHNNVGSWSEKVASSNFFPTNRIHDVPRVISKGNNDVVTSHPPSSHITGPYFIGSSNEEDKYPVLWPLKGIVLGFGTAAAAVMVCENIHPIPEGPRLTWRTLHLQKLARVRLKHVTGLKHQLEQNGAS